MSGVPALLLSGFDLGWIVLYLVLLIFFVLILPVFAVSVFIRVRRLEKRGAFTADPSIIQRVYALEQRLGQLEKSQPQPAAAPAPPVMPAAPRAEPAPPAPAPAIVSPPSAPPREPAAPPRSPDFLPHPGAPPIEKPGGLDMESFIGGRGLMLMGGLLVLLAAAFFLKHAFENNWIGERGRVALGLLAGAGLLAASQQFLKRGYKYFSEVIAALGGGVLYLSLFAGWNYYRLFSSGAAFVSMIVVTAALLAIGVGRNSERLAVLALVGGFLTPWLSSTGQNAQVVLFTYLAVLDAGLLVLARMRNWRTLEPMAFVFTQIYFWGWHGRWYDPPQMLSTTLFATLFFAVFAALPVIRSRASGALQQEQILVMLANALLYLLALRSTLWPDHRWALTLSVLALAAVHLIVARYLPRKEGETPLVYLLFAGLALLFVTLAIPIRLDGKWVTMAWAAEGAILVWTGFRTRLGFLRWAGFVLFGIATFRLFEWKGATDAFLLNARFATFAVVVGSMVAALWFARQNQELASANEQGIFKVMGVAANFLAVWALSLEVFELYSPLRLGPTTGLDARLAQQLALSLLWTLYASALMVAGVRRQVAGLRYQALALLSVTIVKVFLYDLNFLEGFYRIVSSLVLGVVLLAVAFLYQRSRAMKSGEET